MISQLSVMLGIAKPVLPIGKVRIHKVGVPADEEPDEIELAAAKAKAEKEAAKKAAAVERARKSKQKQDESKKAAAAAKAKPKFIHPSNHLDWSLIVGKQS